MCVGEGGVINVCGKICCVVMVIESGIVYVDIGGILKNCKVINIDFVWVLFVRVFV